MASAGNQELDAARLLELSQIQGFMNSDASLDALLARLKKSINTGEEFAKYVKKRAQIEDEHYAQLKKFGSNMRMQYKKNQDSLKNDSFSQNLDQIVGFDEELMNVGDSYVKALTIMYDELLALVATVARSRKLIKDDAKRREKECSDAIQLAEKAKQKYYHLCEDLERLRMSDPGKRPAFSLKNKSAVQQEDDLQRKIDVADQDYKTKVAACKKSKDEILLAHRPTYTKKLKNLILEIDIAMNVQLQKFATWNENLVMKSGVLISPLQNATSKKSMKQYASSINSEMDLYNYLLKVAKVPPTTRLVPVEYKVHPSLAKAQKSTTKPFLNNTSNLPNTSSGLAGAALGASAGAATAVAGSSFNHNNGGTTSFSNGNNSNNFNSSTATTQYPDNFNSSSTGASHLTPAYNSSGPGYPTSPIDTSFIDKAATSPQNSYRHESPSSAQYSSLDPNASAGNTPVVAGESTFHNGDNGFTRPTFGVSIEDVVQFAGVDSVPLIVRRCIDVIETHGLDLEFIYRTSGNKSAVDLLKREIDQSYANYVIIGNDIDSSNVMDAQIHTIASLLKMYFAQLPEPLLTNEYMALFIETMKLQDANYKAKKIHHLVFKLPDGAYFTLRAIMFHLNKVASHKQMNKMSLNALATVWWPALLHDDSSAEDVEYKTMLIEELMAIAPDIFEPDEPEEE